MTIFKDFSVTFLSYTFSALQSAWDAEFDSYKSKRRAAFPSLEEQLDMQYWDAVNGTTTWKDAIAKVKSDNPKPS